MAPSESLAMLRARRRTTSARAGSRVSFSGKASKLKEKRKPLRRERQSTELNTTMAFAQKNKNAMSAAALPGKVGTEHQSLILMKRLLAVAVSSITYLRGLFSENAYATRYLGGHSVKILREDDNCPGSSQIVKWMMGCYDALEKKYLRMLVLAIYTNEDPQAATECYQFKFKYRNGEPLVDFASNNGKIRSTISNLETKKASILLIRRLYLLMQDLGSLPNDLSLKMQLFYYDEVTPLDYQPPGFKEGIAESMVFEGSPVFVNLGEVATPFHVLRMKVTTESEQLDPADQNTQEENGRADRNEQVEISDTLLSESPAASQTLIPEKGNADEQDAGTKTPPKAGKNTSPKKSTALSPVENLVSKTSELELSGRRTRSGKFFYSASRTVEPVDKGGQKPVDDLQRRAAGKKRTSSEQSKRVNLFELPCSQDEASTMKRKKFSEPKERFR